MIPKKIIYDNHTFHLDSLGKYYLADYYDGHGKRKKKLLHRVIWEKETGIPIPKGYVVHHKDENKQNNTIENFELKSFSQHRRDHMLDLFKDPDFLEKNRQQLDKMRPLAAEWHKSEEASRIMSEASRKFWDNAPLFEKICQLCSKLYMTPYPDRSRFCSRRCIVNNRYRLKIGFEERKCIICQNPFFVKKSEPTKTCSHKCGAKYRYSK